jgi:hypothetical protein
MTYEDGKIKELSKLIFNWGLIDVSAKDQFDSFSRKLLIALDRGVSIEKLRAIVESELCLTYGLYQHEFDADKLASQLMQWFDK